MANKKEVQKKSAKKNTIKKEEINKEKPKMTEKAEKNIKEVADYYKGQIPQKVYNALYDYEVEITD